MFHRRQVTEATPDGKQLCSVQYIQALYIHYWQNITVGSPIRHRNRHPLGPYGIVHEACAPQGQHTRESTYGNCI